MSRQVLNCKYSASCSFYLARIRDTAASHINLTSRGLSRDGALIDQRQRRESHRAAARSRADGHGGADSQLPTIGGTHPTPLRLGRCAYAGVVGPSKGNLSRAAQRLHTTREVQAHVEVAVATVSRADPLQRVPGRRCLDESVRRLILSSIEFTRATLHIDALTIAHSQHPISPQFIECVSSGAILSV